MIETAESTELLKVLSRHLRYWSEDQDWSTVSLPDLGLDSMSAIDLVIDIEETFGIVLPEELLVRETFATFPALQAAVRSLVGGR